MSCVLPFISTLSGHVLMVSDLGFFFFHNRFYLRVHEATSTADSLEPEPPVDGTKTHLNCLLKYVAIQGHSQSWAPAASTVKRCVFTSCACVRSCRGGAMDVCFKLYADLLLVLIRTNFFLVIISSFTVVVHTECQH